MPSWLNKLIQLAIGPVRDLANAVRDKLSGLWSTIATVLGNIGAQWARMFNVFDRLRWTLRHVLDEIYGSLWRLVREWIPRFVLSRITEAVRWLSGLIGWVERLARTLVRELGDFVGRELNRIGATLDRVRLWLMDEINKDRALLAWLWREVIPRVTSPARMAEWLAGALLSPLWKVLDQHAEAYAEWVLRNSIRVVMRNIARIERFIVRMF